MAQDFLADRSILVTGGTGSFGRRFAEVVLSRHKPRKLIILSRDELEQSEMREALGDHPALRFFLGDVRDRDRLLRAFKAIDVVVHAAALKQVPAAEYDPDDFYVIQPAFPWWSDELAYENGGRQVPEGFVYASDTNDRWLTVEELRAPAGEADPVAAPYGANGANGHAASL